VQCSAAVTRTPRLARPQEPREHHSLSGAAPAGIGAAQYHLGQDNPAALYPPLQQQSGEGGATERGQGASDDRAAGVGALGLGLGIGSGIGTAATSRRSSTETSRLSRRASNANPIMLAAAAVAAAAESFVGYAIGGHGASAGGAVPEEPRWEEEEAAAAASAGGAAAAALGAGSEVSGAVAGVVAAPLPGVQACLASAPALTAWPAPPACLTNGSG
jgi:hypothetical protein